MVGVPTANFFAVDKNGNKLLIRLSSFDQFETKQQEFDALFTFNKALDNMSTPLLFGKTSEYVFMVLNWVEGMSLETVLPQLNRQTQFHLGVKAGTLLNKIHSLPVPKGWEFCSREQEFTDKLKKYEQQSLRQPHDQLALNYFYNHLNDIEVAQPCLLHGDFHPGNLVIDNQLNIGVIDFNRYRVGDPYYEFIKVEAFTIECSVAFSCGQIIGYFNGEIPTEFWNALKEYCAYSSLFGIVWAVPFGRKDVDGMIRRYNNFMYHFDNMTRQIPTWFENYMNNK